MAIKPQKPEKARKVKTPRPEGEPGKKPKKIKVLVLIIALLVVAIGGSGFYLYKTDKLPELIKEALAKSEPEQMTYVMEEFLLNLSGNRGRDYLKVTLALGYTHPEGSELIGGKNNQIRDTIIACLMRKNRAEVLATDEDTQIKEEMIEKINAWFTEEIIEDIYFTEYLVQ